MTPRYLAIEAPDTAVVVDFLGVGTTATLTREKRAGRWFLVVNVKQDNGDGYTWTEQEHAFPCPVKKVSR